MSSSPRRDDLIEDLPKTPMDSRHPTETERPGLQTTECGQDRAEHKLTFTNGASRQTHLPQV